MLFKYVVIGVISRISLLKTNLGINSQVLGAQSEEELQAVLCTGDYDFRFDCGFSQPTSAITMETRIEFVQAIAQHYCVFSIYAEIMQLRSGLLGVLDMQRLAEDHPVEFWSLMAANSTEKVTAQMLQDLFQVAFHPKGHNCRSQEEKAVMFLYNYFQECEGR